MENELNYKKISYEIPKAELHIHIEGTLEPEYLFELSKKNNIGNFESIESLKERFKFKNLDDFLQILFDCCTVLKDESDFQGLMERYLNVASSQGLIYADIIFGPQFFKRVSHIPLETILNGYWKGIKNSTINADLIMTFDKGLSEEDAFETLKELDEYHKKYNILPNDYNRVKSIGLACSEFENPPNKFKNVFQKAKEMGLNLCSHACEEQNTPLDHLYQALDDLKCDRIDHGTHCWKDKNLVEKIKTKNIPLNVCPLSGVYLKVFQNLEEFPLKQLFFDNDLLITINSDDPSVFGGYIGENYFHLGKTFKLSIDDYKKLASNSIKATFLDEKRKQEY